MNGYCWDWEDSKRYKKYINALHGKQFRNCHAFTVDINADVQIFISYYTAVGAYIKPLKRVELFKCAKGYSSTTSRQVTWWLNGLDYDHIITKLDYGRVGFADEEVCIYKKFYGAKED